MKNKGDITARDESDVTTLDEGEATTLDESDVTSLDEGEVTSLDEASSKSGDAFIFITDAFCRGTRLEVITLPSPEFQV